MVKSKLPDKMALDAHSADAHSMDAHSMDALRIGVYTCKCGGNIGEVVQCEAVARAAGRLPAVVVSRTDLSFCSDAGQAMIEADIRELGVNRVVIGACAPSLHQQTFRGTVARAGLNPYFYHHVGLREQDSWVHHGDPPGASDKALRLLAAGVAKARLLDPLEPIRLAAREHALVIGGGIAGLRAAWDIARRGIQVTLIEKSPFLGGRVAQLETIFPTGESARDLLADLIGKVVSHPKITIYTSAELVAVDGYVGDFQVQIRQHSRGISPDIAGAAMAACTAEAPDEFNYGLQKRKVIYRLYEGCYPPTPAVDWQNYYHGCVQLDGRTLQLQDEPHTFTLHVGAFVVATGFKPYEPHHGEYGYGVHPEVITLPKFIRLLAQRDEAATLHWCGRPVRNLAFIHCVGSRQTEGNNQPQPDGNLNDYCSRVCCTATLQAANELHERFPQVNVFDIYEDIRTYGRGHEAYYTQASRNMVRFLRFHDDELPVVSASPDDDGAALHVELRDYLTCGEELHVPVDLVVLSVGMMPNPIADIAKLLKIAPGADRFLLEVHPKLRPVETAAPGVVLAGTAQGPMNIQESCAAASAAASKVAVLLGRGQVELEPFVAQVDPARCDGQGACVQVCRYEGAIRMETVSENGHSARWAVVIPANCAGCGCCVSACPNRAIDLRGWTLAQYDAMVAALVADNLPELEVAL